MQGTIDANETALQDHENKRQASSSGEVAPRVTKTATSSMSSGNGNVENGEGATFALPGLL